MWTGPEAGFHAWRTWFRTLLITLGMTTANFATLLAEWARLLAMTPSLAGVVTGIVLSTADHCSRIQSQHLHTQVSSELQDKFPGQITLVACVDTLI